MQDINKTMLKTIVNLIQGIYYTKILRELKNLITFKTRYCLLQTHLRVLRFLRNEIFNFYNK